MKEVSGAIRPQLKGMLRLREVNAPEGWTAAVLEAVYPVTMDFQESYHEIVSGLMVHLSVIERAASKEVLLQFDRCDPGREIPMIQANARSWQPEIGLGVWIDRALPSLWTKEEFLAAAPGTLRPLLYRIFRIQSDPDVQASAWRQLLGSGAMMQVALAKSAVFIERATEYLQPRVVELSLASFPFYFPLLTQAALEAPYPMYSEGVELWLPGVDAYLRESVEDGGLLILVRQRPEAFWDALRDSRIRVDVARATRALAYPTSSLADDPGRYA